MAAAEDMRGQAGLLTEKSSHVQEKITLITHQHSLA